MKSPPMLRVMLLGIKQKIQMTVFADMLVTDREGSLIAMRFGGYPETVQAIKAALSGNCRLTVESMDGSNRREVKCVPRRLETRLTQGKSYTECLAYPRDDGLGSLSLEDDSDKEQVQANRNLYFFARNDDELFQALDQKLTVPLIPDFQDYFLKEIKNRSLIQPLQVQSFSQPFSAWHMSVSAEEKEIAAVLEDGLKNGSIRIPGSTPGLSGALAGMNGFSDYLKAFGVQIAERIKDRFPPLYDPGKEPASSHLEEVNRYVESHAGYALFDAQLAASEAVVRQLKKSDLAFLIAECGTGKSKVGSAAAYASIRAQGLARSFNVVICPSHITEKWVRELYETVPNCVAKVATSLSDVDKLHAIYRSEDKHVFCVLSKEKAKNGPIRYPAVSWNPVKKAFCCPDCGAELTMPVFDGETRVLETADPFFFQVERINNHKCPECGGSLWSVINPDVLSPEKNEWVRIGGYGFIHRKFIMQHYNRCKDESIKRQIWEIARQPDGIYPTAGAYRRYPLSTYIKRHIGHVDRLIIDELHEYSGESAQGGGDG